MSIPHVNRKTEANTEEWAIFLQLDDFEWDYLRKGKHSKMSWASEDPVMIFNNKDDALQHASNYNTASVVPWTYKE